MLKNDVAVVGAGLGGATVAYGLQQKNYRAYLINGSEQDNRTIPDAKNVLILEGYDGLAGDRSLALEALQRNKQILKTISEIEQKIVLCVASGGGSTGSGTEICSEMDSKLEDFGINPRFEKAEIMDEIILNWSGYTEEEKKKLSSLIRTKMDDDIIVNLMEKTSNLASETEQLKETIRRMDLSLLCLKGEVRRSI